MAASSLLFGLAGEILALEASRFGAAGGVGGDQSPSALRPEVVARVELGQEWADRREQREVDDLDRRDEDDDPADGDPSDGRSGHAGAYHMPMKRGWVRSS